MSKEQYVTFEVARLLKEKGFDWFTYSYYTKDDVDKEPYFGMENLCPDNWNGQASEVNDLWFSAPTQQMACRWLRKEKGFYVYANYGCYPVLNEEYWIPEIGSMMDFDIPDDFYKEYNSPEDAVEAALVYCLTNLI